MNKVCVALTGAGGFVGKAILRLLKNKNSDASGSALFHRRPIPLKSHLHEVVGNIEQLPKTFFPQSPFVLLHFANKQIDKDGSGFHGINVNGTKLLLNALPSHCRGIIYGSSMSVYGQDAQKNISESSPLRPGTELAKSRALAEGAIFEFAQKQNIPACALRPRFILGQGDRFTIQNLKKFVSTGILINDGLHKYSIIDVDDYAQIIITLVQKMLSEKLLGQTPLNIGYKCTATMRDLCYTVASAYKLNVIFSHISFQDLLNKTLKELPEHERKIKKTQLELIGLDHYANVTSLKSHIGNTLLDRNPFEVIRHAVTMAQ